MSQISGLLTGASFIGDGTEAAHINVVLGVRSGPASPYYLAPSGT
ncbi:MAG: hypothetical protein ACRDPO_00245 [Streptosporangiaceae bacterium]